MKYWDFNLPPYKYTDDIYHIGAQTAPCWLIKSTDGLILLDTGLPQTTYLVIENLRKVGYSVQDVKHIIHSHGHIDHIGGTRAIVELSGAKTYVGEGDVDMVTGVNQLQWTNEFNRPFEEPFTPDVIVKDGQKIVIGDKEFLFVATPGHTQGTLSIFFNCTDNGKTYRAGMFGGGGLKSMEYAYLDKYNLPYSLRDDFLSSIDKVYNEKVEVHLGNHLGDNKHKEKLEKIGQKENPFIDNTTWKWFLDKRKKEAIDFFIEDEKNKNK